MTSDRAVDGNDEGIFTYNSCTHTSGLENPRWTVNLQYAYSFIAIKIKNRDTNRKYHYKFLYETKYFFLQCKFETHSVLFYQCYVKYTKYYLQMNMKE